MSEHFECFAGMAEAAVATDNEIKRRPNFAPFLKLDDNLAATCADLGWLKSDDKAITRLWATFLDPRHRRRHLYRLEDGAAVATGERPAIVCVGGELHIGATRQGERIFSFQRDPTSGRWRTGPIWVHPATLRNQVARERFERFEARYPLVLRATELASALVAGSIGDPVGLMQITGRYCGHCAICGKALAEPLSLERGIGPDCWHDAYPHLGHGWLQSSN